MKTRQSWGNKNNYLADVPYSLSGILYYVHTRCCITKKGFIQRIYASFSITLRNEVEHVGAKMYINHLYVCSPMTYLRYNVTLLQATNYYIFLKTTNFYINNVRCDKTYYVLVLKFLREFQEIIGLGKRSREKRK